MQSLLPRECVRFLNIFLPTSGFQWIPQPTWTWSMWVLGLQCTHDCWSWIFHLCSGFGLHFYHIGGLSLWNYILTERGSSSQLRARLCWGLFYKAGCGDPQLQKSCWWRRLVWYSSLHLWGLGEARDLLFRNEPSSLGDWAEVKVWYKSNTMLAFGDWTFSVQKKDMVGKFGGMLLSLSLIILWLMILQYMTLW